MGIVGAGGGLLGLGTRLAPSLQWTHVVELRINVVGGSFLVIFWSSVSIASSIGLFSCSFIFLLMN